MRDTRAPLADFADFYDLAESLADQYNGYFELMFVDFEPFTAEDIVDALKSDFYLDQVKSLVDDDYGRGILMGLITAYIQAKLAREEDEALDD